MRLLLASLLALPTLPVWATNYTVKPSGGNYATITACVAALSTSGGDTCTVYAGTYAEAGMVTIKAGTAGNYNIVTNNPGDSPTMSPGFVMGSHTKLIGMKVDSPSAPSSNSCVDIMLSTTDAYIVGNTFTECGANRAGIDAAGGINTRITASHANAPNHIYIQNNRISYPCGTVAGANVCVGMELEGDYFLVEGNDISHVSDGVTLIGDHNVFRNNTFHAIRTSDCGGNSSNCHIDFLQAYPQGSVLPPTNMLIEGNYAYDLVVGGGPSGEAIHGFILQDDSTGRPAAYNAIMRFNVWNGAPGYPIFANYNPWKRSTIAYNNSVVNGSLSDCVFCWNSGADYGVVINNLVYNSNPGSMDYLATGPTNFRHANNLGYGGSFTGAFTSETGRVTTNPNFVNPASDWHLANTSSPAYATGAHLTTATNTAASASTALTVANGAYFSDGYTLVSADWIKIGSGAPVQIASMVYPADGSLPTSITLAAARTWTSGDTVDLYQNSLGTVVLQGSAPNIGAYGVGGGGPLLGNNPGSIAFGNQPSGTSSTAQAVVVTNNGTQSATLTGCAISGTNASQFSITDPGNCPGTLAVNGSFTLHVVFSPTTTGAKNANLTISYDAGATSGTSLTGTGTSSGPQLSLNPGGVNCGFSNLNVQITCPAFTLQNTGNSTATLSSFVITGTNASSFAQTNNCAATLAAGATCTITPTMTPLAAGVLGPATLTVTDTPDSIAATATLSGSGNDPNAITQVHMTVCASQTYPGSCTIPATAAGNLIVSSCISGFGFNPGSVSVTDNKGDSFATAAKSQDATTNSMAVIAYSTTGNGGATSVTMTPDSTGTMACVIREVSHVNALDQTAANNSQPAAGSPFGSAVTIGTPQEFLVAVINPQYSITGIHSGSLWTNDTLTFSAGWAYLITGAPGTYQPQWDCSSSCTSNAVTASFKQTVSIGAAPGGIASGGIAAGGVVH